MAHGKIARLPRTIREQLNQRLADGEQGNELVDWLNGLPEVQVVMAERFNGRAISAQNLSEWKQNGYQAWLIKQELVASTTDLVADAKEMEAALGKYALTEPLTVLLGARYAKLLAGWDGTVDKAFLQQVQGLGRLCQQIVALRRSEQAAERLKEKELKAMEGWLQGTEQWPDVHEACRAVFEYSQERRDGGDIKTFKLIPEREGTGVRPPLAYGHRAKSK